MRVIIKLICFLLMVNYLVAQSDFQLAFADSAFTLTKQNVIYDPSYFSLEYPNGDVPDDRGVCTDVVIRAFRKMGIDLQKEVHEDMRANFKAYPNNWGLKTTDKNIDHRRVPNLMAYFSRFGKVKKISSSYKDYIAGDVVCWSLNGQGGIPHIGIVSNKVSSDQLTPMIIHNIGAGQVIEDMLFDYKIIGHYSFE